MFDDSYKVEVKRCAHGHWRDVLQSVGMAAEALDGKGHPCPKCGGVDRFAFTNRNEDGGVICRKCGEHIGDGFATIQWFLTCDFATALKIVADYFHIPSAGGMNSVLKPVAAASAALSAHSATPLCTPTADDPQHEKGMDAKQKTERVEHIYRDLDENGQVVERYRISRINYDDGSKTIRKPTGFNKAHDGILYHLDQLKRDTESPIYFVEGEKDAERLTTAGYLATTCGACGDWKSEYAEHFRNRDVVLFFDCDVPGKKLAQTVVNAISSVVSTLRVVNLEPRYRDEMERLRGLASEKVDPWQGDETDPETDPENDPVDRWENPLYAERERILNNPPKGADISDYLDLLRASRSPDADWSESEDQLEIRNLIHSGYTITVHTTWNLQDQLPFLNSEKPRNKSEASQRNNDHTEVPFDALHQDGDFPAEGFPKATRAYITWNAKYFNQPCEVIGVPLLAVIAGVIGNKRKLRIDDGWHSPSPIWVLLHGSASVGKTPILSCVTSLVDQYDLEKSREYNEAYDVYEAQMAEYKKEKAASKKTERCRKADGESAADDGEQEVSGGDTAGAERKPPKKPFNGSFMVESSTVEGVRKKMESNGGYIFVFDDEFKGFTGAFNQYNSGNGVDVNFWNKTYNGKTGRVLRAGSREQVTPNVAASLLGGIQTEIFEGKDFLENAEYRANGFLARYLIVGIESRPIDQYRPQVPQDVIEDMRQVMEHLFNMRWSGDVFGEPPRSQEHQPVMIEMDNEATDLFWADKKFYDDWKRNRPNDAFSAMIGKFEGGTARIALALHCLKGEPRGGDGSVGRVDQETMEAAIRINFWCAYEWYLTFFGLRENKAKLVELEEEEEKWMQAIRECGGIPKANLRKTGLTSEQKRMTKHLLSRNLLIESDRKMTSGQNAKYIIVAE